MATSYSSNLPLALVDEKGQARWLFTIHASRRLKAVKNPGHASADDMYATSYPVQSMDGGWDADMNPFLFVLAENGMIYHIHHLPPHWQHRAVTRLPLTRVCVNFQAGLLGKTHVLLLQHASSGEWGGTASHYRVQGRDIVPMDTAALPRDTRHIYLQSGPHLACLCVGAKGALSYCLLRTGEKQWSAPAALPYTFSDPAAAVAPIGYADGFHLFWSEHTTPPTGHYAAVSYAADNSAVPPITFAMDTEKKSPEIGWLYRSDAPLPLWQAPNGIMGRDPRQSKKIAYPRAGNAEIIPVRVIRADAQHHRINHTAFAVLSGFVIVAQGITKEGKIVQNAEEEDRLQLIEQRQKRLAAQLKELYTAMTQMQDEMVRQSRVLFQLEAVMNPRAKTIKEYKEPEEEKESPRTHPPQKGLHVKGIENRD